MLLTLALLKPILATSKPRLLPSLSKEKPTTVYVTNEAATRDVNNTHNMLKDFVWSSGCTSWALDPKTGTNIAMYPHYQWNFWLRTLFLNSNDFRYTMARSNGEKGLRKVGERTFIVGFGWLYLRRSMLATLVTVATLWVYKESVRRRLTVDDGLRIVKEGVQNAKDLVGNAFR